MEHKKSGTSNFDLKIVSGNRAGLACFDKLMDILVFANIYNKNANVLAAMPSIHSAYLVVVLYYSIKNTYLYTLK